MHIFAKGRKLCPLRGRILAVKKWLGYSASISERQNIQGKLSVSHYSSCDFWSTNFADAKQIQLYVFKLPISPLPTSIFRCSACCSFTRMMKSFSTFMYAMKASYGVSYGLKYLCTFPSVKYFVHM